MAEAISFSELDSRRFGRRIFRGQIDGAASVEAAVERARYEKADAVFVRSPSRALDAAQALERAGFRLKDTLVWYAGKTARFAERAQGAPGVRVEIMASAELAELEQDARVCFRDYGGHYHADPRLDPSASTEGYVERFRRSAKDPSFVVLAAQLADAPVGFLTLDLGGVAEGREADIALNAVAPHAQGRGVYDTLLKEAGHRLHQRGVGAWTVSTQLWNTAPQRAWVRNGLEPRESFYTFHLWLAS